MRFSWVKKSHQFLFPRPLLVILWKEREEIDTPKSKRYMSVIWELFHDRHFQGRIWKHLLWRTLKIVFSSVQGWFPWDSAWRQKNQWLPAVTPHTCVRSVRKFSLSSTGWEGKKDIAVRLSVSLWASVLDCLLSFFKDRILPFLMLDIPLLDEITVVVGE